MESGQARGKCSLRSGYGSCGDGVEQRIRVRISDIVDSGNGTRKREGVVEGGGRAWGIWPALGRARRRPQCAWAADVLARPQGEAERACAHRGKDEESREGCGVARKWREGWAAAKDGAVSATAR